MKKDTSPSTEPTELLRRVLWAAKRGPAKTREDLEAMQIAEDLIGGDRDPHAPETPPAEPKTAAIRYALALMRGRLDVEAPTNAAIIRGYIAELETAAQISCLLCGHTKERSTYNAVCGCFVCVDCVHQRNGHIEMVNVAAQERGRAIRAEAAALPRDSGKLTLQDIQRKYGVDAATAMRLQPDLQGDSGRLRQLAEQIPRWLTKDLDAAGNPIEYYSVKWADVLALLATPAAEAREEIPDYLSERDQRIARVVQRLFAEHPTPSRCAVHDAVEEALREFALPGRGETVSPKGDVSDD